MPAVDEQPLAPRAGRLPAHLEALHHFVTDRALPLWATAGVHPGNGAFVEHLHLDGRPDLEAVRRMRVQARQIYVYAHATVLGLFDGRLIAERALERLLADYWQPDGGGFILSVDASGRPADRRRTAYDQAFGILALAWMHRLTGDPFCLEFAGRVLRFMDEHLADRQHGGYADSVGAETRCQNPHMHLLEALLALAEAAGHTDALSRADGLYALFSAHFLDRSIPALREFFVPTWQPDPAIGDRIDPGHQLEWVWLLDQYRRRRPAAPDDTGVLFAFAMRHGLNRRDGLVLDEVAADGSVLRGTSRLWPQTELLKAQVVRHERGLQAGLEEIDRVCGLLLEHYLIEPVGTWNDQVDPAGVRLSRTAPASSFYHLFLAYSEAMRVARDAIQAEAAG